MTQDRIVSESASVDMGGGISAVCVISISADADITDIQLGANCEVCQAHYWHKRPQAKYCSGRCRTRAWRERKSRIRKDFAKKAGKAMAGAGARRLSREVPSAHYG